MPRLKKKKVKSPKGQSFTPQHIPRYEKGAALGPAPSQVYQPSPFAPDSLYYETIGGSQQGYEAELADIAYDRTQVGYDYGFNAQGGLDMSNPYNRATLLQRTYEQSQRGSTNSMAARGQLYSGALSRGLAEGTFRYSRDYDSLRNQAMGYYHDLDVRAGQAEFAKSEAERRAMGDAIARAPEPTDPGPPIQPGIQTTPRDPGYKPGKPMGSFIKKKKKKP